MKDYTNYHGLDYVEKVLYDADIYFTRMLESSPEAFTIKINGNDHRAIIRSTTQPNQRDVLIVEDTIHTGDIVEFGAYKWLVMTLPENNQMYDKVRMRICNDFITIVEQGEKVIIDYDALGRPIYEYQKDVDHHIPCVVANKVQAIYDREDPINLPENRLVIHAPYSDLLNLDLNTTLHISNDDFVIYNIDTTDVMNDKGVVRLFVERSK